MSESKPVARVAVTDACIFIDLMELKIISDFFDLKLEIHTTVDVMMELYPGQREILKAYQVGDKLIIHNLNNDQIKEIKNIPFQKVCLLKTGRYCLWLLN